MTSKGVTDTAKSWTRREAITILAAPALVGCQSGAKTEPSPILAVRPLGPPPWPTRDPFLFCVHHDDAYPAGNAALGPSASLAGRSLGQDFGGKDGWSMYHGEVVPGFPSHPHRGFETVTVVRRGLVDHSDSLGAAARYGQGDVQWLTAGRGIQHAEMFPLLDGERDNPLELFQIWLNLPRRNKMVEPHFAMLWAPTIPRATLLDPRGRPIELTAVAGDFLGTGELRPPAPPPSSWARADGEVTIWTLELAPGAELALPPAPAGTLRTLYFFRGDSLGVAGTGVPGRHLVELTPERPVLLEAGATECEVLVLGGRPIGEPVVKHGPFVMNTREEIERAYHDFRQTRFGGWPWPGPDPVHARAERFARRPDGAVERPT